MQMSHDQKVTAFLMETCGTRCIAAAFLDFFMSVSVSDTMPRATCGCTRARRRAAGAAERSKTAARARLRLEDCSRLLGPPTWDRT